VTKNAPYTQSEAEAKVAEIAKFPRVTKQSIEDKIKTIDYYEHGHLTICVITMQNGFMVNGQSAPADTRNYDADVGKSYAYENAFKQLWVLEGYLLRQKLHDSGESLDNAKAESSDVNVKTP